MHLRMGYVITQEIFWPGMENLNLIMRKQQTNSN